MGSVNRADRVYERLLQVYPRAYRQRFGLEMRQVLRDIYREHTEASRPAWLLWGRTLADLGMGAVTQHSEVIRSKMVMKQYFSNSANQKSFLWGVALMVPAGLFFLFASMSSLLNYSYLNNIKYKGATLYLFLTCLIVLPLLAVTINILPLAHQVVQKKEGIISLAFIKRNFWTFAVMIVGLGWIAFLFGHDTVGCAVQYLPQLKWQAFQHCAATH